MTTEYKCWAARGDDGWHCDVVLFDGAVRGEIRMYHNGVLKWTHPIELAEIAAFAAKRSDVIGPYLDGLMALYREH